MHRHQSLLHLAKRIAQFAKVSERKCCNGKGSSYTCAFIGTNIAEIKLKRANKIRDSFFLPHSPIHSHSFKVCIRVCVSTRLNHYEKANNGRGLRSVSVIGIRNSLFKCVLLCENESNVIGEAFICIDTAGCKVIYGEKELACTTF